MPSMPPAVQKADRRRRQSERETTTLEKTAAAKDCFPRLWRLLSFPKSDVWFQNTSSAEGVSRLRNAVELLAPVLWHLELVSSLGELSDEITEAHRREMCESRGLPLPWK